MMKIPLRIISDYSLLKSLISLPKIIPFLKSQNIDACGICDDNLYGVMEFYDLCLQNQIKPIVGLNVPFLNVELAMYAKNYHGYQNLLKIHTIIQNKEEVSALDKKYFDDLVIMMDTSFITSYDTIKPFFDDEDFFLAVNNEEEKKNAYLKTNKVIYAPLIRCFKNADASNLDLLKAIFLNTTLDSVNKSNYQYQSLENFLNSKEDNSFILSKFDLVIPKNNRYIPHYDENIKDSYAYLTALAKKGLTKRLNGNISKEYQNRLLYELDVINKMGFVDYFLIVYDYVKYAKQNDILVGMGRGSAAGSLVSFAIGITDVDPIKYHLLFERFLNPERISMPDIDIDFEDTKRNLVVDYVKERYGKRNVANIITFGTLKCKLAIRCVCKALKVNDDVMEKLVSLIDAKEDLKTNMLNPLVKTMVMKDDLLKEVIRKTSLIEGLKKHISTHAAGVVISSVPLDEVIPIYLNNEELVTGISMNYLEELGLIKMDFLSIKNLTIIANVLNLIKNNTGKTINLTDIDYNDSKIMNLFKNGDTIGIFQFESEGIKNFLRKLKPENFLDIVSAIALYRPGPMGNIDTFIKRKNKEELVTYLDPSLEPILKETYGIIVYQEQIMQILVKVGGYSYAEADLIRRAMSKKKRSIMEAEKTKFLQKASANGYQLKVAEEIYNLILKFALYGFNKSHSVSYALIGVQMAYLKCYYPIYFITNLLNMAINSTVKTKEYMTMAKKYNIKFLPPSINYSTDVYEISQNTLRIPFTLIKNLGMEATKNIILEREKGLYTDYLDFVSRTYGKSVNKKTIEALIMADALSEFNLNHETLRNNLDKALDYASLVNDLASEYVLKPEINIYPSNEKDEKRKEEYLSFGFYISNHPSSAYQNNIMKISDIKNHFNEYVRCVILIESIKKIKTKDNLDMAFINASDESGLGNFVLFHNELKKVKDFKVGDLVMVSGRVAKRFASYQVNINNLQILEK